jgi:hypothetical protein
MEHVKSFILEIFMLRKQSRGSRSDKWKGREREKDRDQNEMSGSDL